MLYLLMLVPVSLVPSTFPPVFLTFCVDEACCLTWLCVCAPSSRSRPPRSTARYGRRLYVWPRPWPWPETDSHWAAGLLQCSPGLHEEGENERADWLCWYELDGCNRWHRPKLIYGLSFHLSEGRRRSVRRRTLILNGETQPCWSVSHHFTSSDFGQRLWRSVNVNLWCLSRAPIQIVCFTHREC